MCKRKKLALIFCTAAFIQTAGVSAATTVQEGGTITFTGIVSDATCIITGGDINNPSGTSADFTVRLPMVSPTQLDSAGKTAGTTDFFIKLSGANCANDIVANVRFKALAATPIDSVNGNLTNIEVVEKANNAQIRLLNKDKSPINLNNAATEKHQEVTIANNAAQFDYSAQYFATAAATPGKVLSTLGYDIEYN